MYHRHFHPHYRELHAELPARWFPVGDGFTPGKIFHFKATEHRAPDFPGRRWIDCRLAVGGPGEEIMT